MSRYNRRTDAVPGTGPGPGASFLPEDYLRRKGEVRSVVISVALFAVVTLGVVGAFFVKHREWNDVKERQEQINSEYATETKKIEQLKELESQRDELKDKADVITALIEKAPRSIMLAELINRMPKQLTLTELNLRSKRVSEPARKDDKARKGAQTRSLAGAKVKEPAKAPDKAKEAAPARPAPPRFEFTIELIGLSNADEDVADYHKSLAECPLLERVEMLYSGEVIIDEVPMRKFRIECGLRNTADARHIEPLHVPRLTSVPSLTGPVNVREEPREGAPAEDQRAPAGAAHKRRRTASAEEK